jgi:hypothetical protein
VVCVCNANHERRRVGGHFFDRCVCCRIRLRRGWRLSKENEPSTNFARSNDDGKTWTAGPQLPGYRSGIHNVSSGTGTEMFIAVARRELISFVRPAAGSAPERWAMTPSVLRREAP